MNKKRNIGYVLLPLVLAIGTVGGIMTSAKLTNYRIQELEKKVDKHNNFAQRVPILEEKVKLQEQRISTIERNEYYE